MIPGVVANRMPGFRYLSDDFRIFPGIFADHKESRVNLMFFQDIQQTRRIFRMRAIVKRQRDSIRYRNGSDRP